MATPQYNFIVNLDDLAFILKQIKIAEATTVINPVTGQGDVVGLANLISQGGPSTAAALLPSGLRTVDGTWNNLVPGQERFGAADNVMPRLVAGTFHAAQGRPVNFFGPGDPGSASSSYAQTAPGNIVYDTQPRVISNLIVDETAHNPAAVAAANNRAAISTFPGANVVTVTANGTLVIPNQSPDIGLSAPFNGVMTFFGQFFDHGLDLITKGGGTVFVPLRPDDPLYVAGSPTNFMVLSRAVNTTGPGPDGILGTADDDLHGHTNTTTPFVDQNQTYTSHPSHQVFLREYTMVGGKPLATGHLLNGAHGEGNWGEVKAQASHLLGIHLTDTDVFNVPLLATDRYGEFIRGPNGFVQIVTATGLIEGDPTANGGLGVNLPANTVRTDHQFLIDIAHGAAPNPGLVADSDSTLGGLPNPAFNPLLPITTSNTLLLPQPAGTYDNEMLDRHFATGDGRGNENIGLTAMHSIFHSEHNRLVEDYKQTILGSGNLALINEWLSVPVTAMPVTPAAQAALVWDGERLFQAGRFGTEMQYQHLVFEEFARAVQPSINPFVFSNSPNINPAIVEEFANVVYRFGHSMLTETVARLGPNLVADDVGLIQAFLNPPEFDKGGVSEATAIGGIIRGMSRQVGNEIDEFITEALRNNLVGLPLDLAVLNIARARETGAPTFNEARASFFTASGDVQLKPYLSWADMAPHLKNPASIINFIAAYGQHTSILAETTTDGKRAAATALVLGTTFTGAIHEGVGLPTTTRTFTAPTDRVDFLSHIGTWSTQETGLNNVDFWVGGLAEAKLEFGGMLGPTFDYVFKTQLQKLQNGDRFYYLSRTQGLNLLNELEGNTFAALAMRNSDLGNVGNTTHLPGKLFDTPSYTLEMNIANQRTGIIGPDGVTLNGDPIRGNPILDAINSLVTRVAPGADVNGDGFADGGVLSYAFDGGAHVVIGGTQGNDTLLGGRGRDTLWGDAGDDRIDGGDEADEVFGGDGDDIITDHGTPVGGADFLRGEAGNDVISSGPGADLVLGGDGTDFLIAGNDGVDLRGGQGDDFLLGGTGSDVLMGDEGDDWIEGGDGLETLSGENSQLFFNSTIIGHDVLDGQGNDTDYDGESGDDIMVQGPGIQRNNGMFGFDWGIHKGDPVGGNSDLGLPLFTAAQPFILRDRFASVEGLSGWIHNDTLTGANQLGRAAAGAFVPPGSPPDESDLKSQNVSLINGFAELLGLTPAQVAAMPLNTSVIDVTKGAEVIIGGGGSDRITGNLGNDYLDGDAWLNVRIRVTHKDNPLTAVNENANTAANEWFTVDSMNALTARMLSGEINPSQLHIVREILQSTTAATDVDTAVYNGLRSEYTVTPLGDGRITVTHNNATALSDGVDTIRNFERLEFADQTVVLQGTNAVGTGTVTVSSLAPIEKTALSVSGIFSDLNGVNTASIVFTWQSQIAPNQWVDAGTGTVFTPGNPEVGLALRVKATFLDLTGVTETVFSTVTSPVVNVNDLPVGLPVISGIATQNQILSALVGGISDADGLGPFSFQWSRNGVAIVGATAQALTLTQADVGQTMTVRVSYTDLHGTPETLISAPTTPVVNVNDPTVGNVTISNLTPDLLRTLTVTNNLTDPDGPLTLLGYQWQSAPNGTTTWTDILGATTASFTTNTPGVQLRVVASYTVAGGPVEFMISNPVTAAVGNFHIILGTNAAGETLTGTAVADHITALGGNDILNGLGGNDVLIGGAGIDTMQGGAGDDTYEVTETGDLVVENLNEGIDRVLSGTSRLLKDGGRINLTLRRVTKP